MSRTVAQIKQSIIDEKANHEALAGANSPSQTGIYNLWMYVTAVAMWIHEQLWDLFKIELEAVVENAQIGTDSWVQDQAFKFQYDATTPQIIQLNNFVPSYPVIDEDKKLITRCSVKTLPNKIVSIKVAKEEPPVPLTTLELNSFTGYLDELSFAGVVYSPVSLNADKCLVDAEIYYNGQYAAVISDTVIEAINNYFSNIAFDGIVRISALEDAIQAVPGVTDVVLNNVTLRSDVTAFGSRTYLVQSNATVFNKYGLVSGYVVGETTTGYTLEDTLTFITE